VEKCELYKTTRPKSGKRGTVGGSEGECVSSSDCSVTVKVTAEEHNSFNKLSSH
jgi:hypothetical protein